MIGGEVLDDAVAIPLRSNTFLLTLHGNPRLVDALQRQLEAIGGTWVDEAGALSLTAGGLSSSPARMEALVALPSVPSAVVAGWLLDQSDPGRGGLAGWVRNRAPQAPREEVAEVASRRWGLGLLDPPTVVLSGPPNAGKSTLFNYWVGRRRVVEHEVPGTTRDLIAELVEFRGFPIRVIDGAGIRATTDRVEREGVRRMEAVRREADLVLQLVPPGDDPASDAFGGDDLPTRALKIRSRFDQISPSASDDSLIGASARTGAGVDRVERVVLERLYGVSDLNREPAPFTRRQADLLEAAAERLEKGDDTHAIWAQF